MGQNIFSIEHGNCRDPSVNAGAMFYSCKSRFREKNPVLPVEKFLFLVLAMNTTMLQPLIAHILPHCDSVKWSLTGG